MAEQAALNPDTATKAKPYVCTTCTRPFARLEHLKRHERSHTKEKPFSCDQAGGVPGCGRRFARRDLLLRHQQKIHLFPNTSKRRRLSTVSNISNVSSHHTQLSVEIQHTPQAQPQQLQQQQQQPFELQGLPRVPREQVYVMSIPSLDDMTNFENGTVNPSSIFSSSPTTTAQAIAMPDLLPEDASQQLSSFDDSSFCFATEKLLPSETECATAGIPIGNRPMWQMPELSMAGSPSSTNSSHYSPSTTYGSLGQASSLEMAGMDSDFFSPDFFVGNGSYRPQYVPSSQTMTHSQLFITSQLEQLAGQKSSAMTSTGQEEPFQFAGGEQAYCNGFRPTETVHTSMNYVESF